VEPLPYEPLLGEVLEPLPYELLPPLALDPLDEPELLELLG